MKKITFLLVFVLFSTFIYAQTTTVFIKSINVSKFPATKASGKAWDNRFENYKPDVYVNLQEKYHNKKIHSYLYTDFQGGEITFQESMIIMANDYDIITMSFLDQDSITSDDLIGTFTINHANLENGIKYYDDSGVFEKRIILVDSGGFQFELSYHLKKDIGTITDDFSKKQTTENDSNEDSEEINDEKAKALINGNWKSSCGRAFTLVAIGKTFEDSVIKQFVSDKEVVFKPIEINNIVYFQTTDRTKKFTFKDTQTIEYETTDGFKCTWTKE